MTAIGTQISAGMRRKPIGGAPDVTAPDAPTSLIATPGDNTVGLTWTDPVDVDLAGVRIWRKTGVGSYSVLSGLIAPGVQSYDDDTAINGTTYSYKAYAEDSVPNVSSASNEEEVEMAVIGEIKLFGGSSAPSTYAFADGTAISRTTYASLFAVYGTVFGVGDGSTTFNLPDLRGRSPTGVGTGAGLTARALAASGGHESLASHTHLMNVQNTELSTTPFPSGNYLSVGGGGTDNYRANKTAHTLAADAIATAGTGNAGNMPPFLALNFIIYHGVA